MTDPVSLRNQDTAKAQATSARRIEVSSQARSHETPGSSSNEAAKTAITTAPPQGKPTPEKNSDRQRTKESAVQFEQINNRINDLRESRQSLAQAKEALQGVQEQLQQAENSPSEPALPQIERQVAAIERDLAAVTTKLDGPSTDRQAPKPVTTGERTGAAITRGNAPPVEPAAAVERSSQGSGIFRDEPGTTASSPERSEAQFVVSEPIARDVPERPTEDQSSASFEVGEEGFLFPEQEEGFLFTAADSPSPPELESRPSPAPSQTRNEPQDVERVRLEPSSVPPEGSGGAVSSAPAPSAPPASPVARLSSIRGTVERLGESITSQELKLTTEEQTLQTELSRSRRPSLERETVRVEAPIATIAAAEETARRIQTEVLAQRSTPGNAVQAAIGAQGRIDPLKLL